MAEKLLLRDELLARLRIKKSQLDQMILAGEFPPLFAINGERRKGAKLACFESNLDAYYERKRRAQRDAATVAAERRTARVAKKR